MERTVRNSASSAARFSAPRVLGKYFPTVVACSHSYLYSSPGFTCFPPSLQSYRSARAPLATPNVELRIIRSSFPAFFNSFGENFIEPCIYTYIRHSAAEIEARSIVPPLGRKKRQLTEVSPKESRRNFDYSKKREARVMSVARASSCLR